MSQMPTSNLHCTELKGHRARTFCCSDEEKRVCEKWMQCNLDGYKGNSMSDMNLVKRVQRQLLMPAFFLNGVGILPRDYMSFISNETGGLVFCSRLLLLF